VLVVASRDHALQAYDLPEDPRIWLDEAAVAWGWNEGGPSARASLLLGDRKGRVSTASGQVLLEGPATRIRWLAGAKGVVLAGGDDGVVRVVGESARELARRDRPVSALAISLDGTRAAIGWEDGSLLIWELSRGVEVASSRASPTKVLAFSADGRFIAQARADRHVALIDAATGKEEAAIELKAVASSLAFAGAGMLAVGLDRGGVLLDVPAMKEAGTLGGPNEPLRTLSFSPDQTRLSGGSDDGQAYVWDLPSRRLSHVLPLDAGDVMLVRFVDDEHLVVAGSDRSVRAVSLPK
jgi:WD40 repeat protein